MEHVPDGRSRSRGRLKASIARGIGAAVLMAALPLAAAEVASAKAADPYSVLVFTKNATVGAAEGVAALQAAAPADATFEVTSDASRFTDAGLAPYEAVVFLNTTGELLDPAQQTAFETFFKAGGGFLGVGSAIDAEPDWPFMTNLLGTRKHSVVEAAQATIEVADRGHSAGKGLPEYWQRTDRWFNFTSNVRGVSHVIATVDEGTYTGGNTNGAASPSADHPVMWCKDYQGGRSFYTALGNTAQSFAEPNLRTHLGGAVQWAAGKADAVYSDCGATVLANYQQTKISAPPNLNEPIGFDQFPDGRIIQTARAGQVRLHDPVTQTSRIIANIPVYTHSEDGLYGGAVDNDFATNKWVYLFYAPPTVRLEQCDGTFKDVTTPANPPGGTNVFRETPQADPCYWQNDWGGYFQLSRFKFVDGENPSLDLASEQKIMQVPNNRGACCHVAGDIDFDKDNNLWLVTGDDTPAGSGGSGGFGPFNDQKTDEQQTIRVNNATGGTFTLTFSGQTTAALPFNATAAQTEAALEALSNLGPDDITVNGGTVNAGNQTAIFGGALAATDVAQLTFDGSGLTGTTPAIAIATTVQANLFMPPHVDARRTSLNTNDLRGKILRIKVAGDGSYTSLPGNLFPESEDTDNKTRPEIYAMGFRNPFRIQVDDNNVAYITDYSPDSGTPQQFRGPQGTGRVEVVRKAANYGWPVCMTPDVPYFQWNFNSARPLNEANPTTFECNNPQRGPANTSRWNTGRTVTPPITKPDIYYSFNAALGTPCFAAYGPSPLGTCPQLFPDFPGTGQGNGVGPHGAAPYKFNASNPNPRKFPPYYDGAFVLGEFTRDTLREVRLDSQGGVHKVNLMLNCGQTSQTAQFPFECDNPMDMQFGADGAFYLLTYGDGFFAANADAGMYKWEYVKGQRAPTGVLTTDRTDGANPLTVQFSSAGSRDPDPGDALTYAWDFDGNGTTDSTAANPTHTYTTNGVFVARLTVTDSNGLSDSKTTTITVGNTTATIEIKIPAEGDFFTWGDVIPYEVVVTDPEDGTVDCSRVIVTAVLLHDTHGHGGDTKTGCKGFLGTNAEDASHGGYIATGIDVSYTDRGANGQPALTAQKQAVVQVRRQQVEYVQDQSGTAAANAPAGETDPAGPQVRNSLDPGDWLALNRSYNLQNSDKRITFRFAGGSATNAAGADRVAVEIRTGSRDGPDRPDGHAEVHRHQQQHVHRPDVRPELLGLAAPVLRVPGDRRHGCAGEQLRQPQLDRVQRARRRYRPGVLPAGARAPSAATCRRRCR